MGRNKLIAATGGQGDLVLPLKAHFWRGTGSNARLGLPNTLSDLINHVDDLCRMVIEQR